MLQVVGLGTGSTAAFAVDRLADLLDSGELKDIVAIPSSIQTHKQAQGRGIPLTTLDEHPRVDVAIDGADEVDPALNLVKGRGGALVREKMLEQAAATFVCIVDDSKMVEGLGGSKLAMPVEIIQFCWKYNLERIKALPSVAGCEAKLRMAAAPAAADGAQQPFVSDNGNYIVDLYFQEPMQDPARVASELMSVCGVVDHGLFLNMADAVIVAAPGGVIVKEKSPQ